MLSTKTIEKKLQMIFLVAKIGCKWQFFFLVSVLKNYILSKTNLDLKFLKSKENFFFKFNI
jgi:hypothetical protein